MDAAHGGGSSSIASDTAVIGSSSVSVTLPSSTSIVTTPSPLKTMAFITHDWDTLPDGTNNHDLASRVNDFLKAHGIVTWFDADRLKGYVKHKMAEGIDNTDCVVVFVNRRYLKMEEVNSNDINDNCCFEFGHAVNQRGNKIIPVLVEGGSMKDPNTWIGVGGAVLGRFLYVDLTNHLDPVAFEKSCRQLMANIVENSITSSPAILSAAPKQSSTSLNGPLFNESAHATLTGHTRDVNSVVFVDNRQSNEIASVSDDKTIRVWKERWNGSEHEWLLHNTFSGPGQHDRNVRSVAVLYHILGSFIITGSDDGTAKIWDSNSGTCLKTLSGHFETVRSIAAHSDLTQNTHIVVTGSHDNTIKVWQVVSSDKIIDAKCLHTLYGHTNWVRSVAFDKDGRIIISASDDKT